MRILKIFLLVFILPITITAQWEWMHPKPTSHYLQSVFTIENIAFTVGEAGTILKSTDSGINWVVLNSGTSKNLNSIYFTDVQQGYAVGENSTILKTTDGGNNWITSSIGTENSLNSVFFIDQQNGFCCGDNGTFLITSNAGISWESKDFMNNYDDLKGMYFLNFNEGFISVNLDGNYNSYGHIFKTTDSGTTWTNVHEEYQRRFYSIQFTNENTGYVASSYGILKTMDSGINWNILNTGLMSFFSLSFPSSNLGFALGDDYIFRTTDAGSNWTQLGLNFTSGGYHSIKFKDSNNGVAVGNYGLIIRTSNGGSSWEKINKGSDYQFNSIRCSDLNTCYAAGMNSVYTPNPEAGGIVIKSTNGGNDWTIIKSRDGDFWQSIFITENGNIFIASDYGNIIKTMDGGLNWDWLNTGTSEYLTSIYFPTDNVGYAAGLNGTIIKTTDSGNTWSQLNSGANRSLQDIFFTDENTGYVISGWPSTSGVAGIIYKTTDAGINWIQLSNDTTKSLLSIHFPSQNIGYAAGQDCIIYKTTDAGLSWNILTSLFSSYNAITSLYFLNTEVGFATTLSFGNIYKTTDGGNNWNLFSINVNTNLQSVHFADPNNGFIAGNIGIILKTTNGGVTFVEEEDIDETPTEFLLSQNYPNPFNPVTKIKYTIPALPTGQAGSLNPSSERNPSDKGGTLVQLIVYDILGREIAVLVNEEKQLGVYEIEFDGNKLSSGVYLYRLTAGEFSDTKKLVLLK